MDNQNIDVQNYNIITKIHTNWRKQLVRTDTDGQKARNVSQNRFYCEWFLCVSNWFAFLSSHSKLPWTSLRDAISFFIRRLLFRRLSSSFWRPQQISVRLAVSLWISSIFAIFDSFDNGMLTPGASWTACRPMVSLGDTGPLFCCL